MLTYDLPQGKATQKAGNFFCQIADDVADPEIHDTLISVLGSYADSVFLQTLEQGQLEA